MSKGKCLIKMMVGVDQSWQDDLSGRVKYLVHLYCKFGTGGPRFDNFIRFDDQAIFDARHQDDER